MTATIAVTKLPTATAKRDAELAARFAAVGLTLHGVDVYKQGYPVTRYALRFTDPRREEPATMRAERGDKWTAHTIYADGIDNLNDLTGDRPLLAYVAWLVRHRAYDKPLDRKHGVTRGKPDSFGYQPAPDAPRDVLARAESAYQRADLNLARYELGMPASGDDLARLQACRADARRALADAIAIVNRRDADAARICPRPADPQPYDPKLDYHRDAAYREALERKYRHERAQH